MCEQTEINYLDGDVVWVKLGSCWWPGEVVGSEKLPPDVLPSFRKPPIAVVKFFQEDTYEYVKNLNSIYKYNCSRKNEFINKGLYMYRTKHGHMEKFPEDVIRAETAVGGDIKILTRDEFQETKKESYAGLFGDPAKRTPCSGIKGRAGRSRPPDSSKLSTPLRKFKEKTNYKVHILLQGSKTPNQAESVSTPSTSRAGSEPSETQDKQENKDEENEKPQTISQTTTFNTPTMSSAGIYACHACNFTTTRLNVLILHNKTHSVTFMPYTPTPIKKKPTKSPKSTPLTTKTSKTKKSRQEKLEKPKKSQNIKRSAEPEPAIEVKKQKTDEEIKSSLLADWDDGDDESIDDSAMAMTASPEVPMAAESPAVPTPAELPSAQVPEESVKKQEEPETEKPESSSDSKYEFCEDEDWPVEADIGRKIPRVKNPSKRKGETKSVSIDEDEIAKEVADLLNKTTLPELPAAPEPLKVEENFPEPSIVKSPDKKTDVQDQNYVEKKSSNDPQPSKTIFKTKTFFRSRHSRSQDAIGKYVAEQLNAAERMDIADNDINGSEASTPEIRVSPPIEHVKVARLAPKIQLKKMKAEAAQQRELEKINAERLKDDQDTLLTTSPGTHPEFTDNINEKPTYNTLQSFSLDFAQNEYEEKNYTGAENEIPLNKSVAENINKENNILNNNDTDNENALSVCNVSLDVEENTMLKLKEKDIPETKPYEPFMNESTASAVDALLSVSRETDRVTKVISDDPPEDLFEDDVKESIINNINGYNNADSKSNGMEETMEDTSNLNKKENENEHDILQNININTELVNTVACFNSPSENAASVKETHLEEDYSNSNICEETLIQNIIPTENIEPKIISSKSNEIFPVDKPTESDLQIAEALINLPTTTMQNKAAVSPAMHGDSKKADNINENIFENKIESESVNPINISHSEVIIDQNNEDINSRFETELEKSENLNAAQSLVQMSETIDHKMKIPDIELPTKDVLGLTSIESEMKVISPQIIEQSIKKSNNYVDDLIAKTKPVEIETKSPKLLKILEEPVIPKLPAKKIITKQIIVPTKEKILNFDVGKSIKSKPQSLKQKIIVRRTTTNTNLLNNLTEVTTPDKIILSRTNNKAQDGSSVQTYTIQTSQEPVSDPNTIIIQQKVRKITKPMSKLQKIKPQPQISIAENKIVKDNMSKEDAIFDINSMPIVISDDILTPENIEKMPIVMSDGNVITNSTNPPKLVKSKSTLIENDKAPISAMSNKTEIKTLLMNSNNEVSKVTTPNILSKSSKLRGSKPMLVIDKTVKQKFIMTKTETAVKEIKQPPALIQTVPQNTGKTEKFIILPSPSSPRPGRTQKIVIDPQTGKAHVLVGKGPETSMSGGDNKPVSAKLIPSASDASSPGNTVMIITNAQGAQSRIVLTPEHEKILFPNKQQPNVSQLKSLTQRITSNTGLVQKTIVSSAGPTKTQTRIVPKQKSAIITSKGQLIVGNRICTTTQNISPLPEIRPAPKRILASEPKKLVQTIQKNSSERLIFLQQKSGAVMQLTAAQFEHLQRTGQIIQSKAAGSQEKIIVQKSVTLPPSESIVPTIQKQRIRKQPTETPTPPKRVKHEIAIAPAPAPVSMPALAPISHTIAPSQVPNISSTTNNPAASNFSEMDNFEELLPSTTIARQESLLAQPEISTQPAVPAPLSDGQLLAVPGEHFGGPPGSFYLCVEENGTYNVIDNRPLLLDNNQLVPMAETLPVLAPVPERRDILEAALANSDVFHAETPRDEAPDFRDLNANVSVHCRVSETSTTLNQPIMTPVEVPSKGESEPAVPSNLEDGLAVIGVTPHTVPTSLELPITVTDPRIAPKTTDPLSNNNYGTTILSSPNTELKFSTAEELPIGPISMPILTEEESVGKSMPILTDEVNERTISSVESTIGSPSSIDVRESENEDSGQWPRRLLTPCSDTSETSAEIPLQPIMQLSVSELSHSS